MKKFALMNALAVGVLSIGFAVASPQQAVTQLRTNADQVLSILSQANGSNNTAVRRQAENYAIPYFDFERMTALCLRLESQARNKPSSSTTEPPQSAAPALRRLHGRGCGQTGRGTTDYSDFRD